MKEAESQCSINIICRICEKKVPANFMAKHTDICLKKIELKKEITEIDKKINEICESAY